MESPRLKAAQKGELHYDGITCRRCGNTLKYTSSGNCVHCSRETVKKYRERVRELMQQAKEAPDVA